MAVRVTVDHDGRDHAEHAVGALGVAQDMAVESPDTRRVAIDDHVVAFAGSRSPCRHNMGLRQVPAVLGEDQLLQPVQVHGVDDQSLVHGVTDADFLAQLGDNRLGVRGSPCR